MATMRGARLAVGSAAWIAEERSSALHFAQSEIEEFSYSARNEVEWLNEHMAEIFSENQINVAEIFKTPGKLRGRTPRTARKGANGQARQPLSDLFSATPKGAPNPFASPGLNARRPPKVDVAQDKILVLDENQPSLALMNAQAEWPQKNQASRPGGTAVDSGYHGSQSEEDADNVEQVPPGKAAHRLATRVENTDTATVTAPLDVVGQGTPTQASLDQTFQSAKEEQTRQVAEQTLRLKMAAEEAAAQSPAKIHSRDPLGLPKPALKPSSPARTSPIRTSPLRSPLTRKPIAAPPADLPTKAAAVDESLVDIGTEGARTPSEGSSPIRQIVRKSSLNFASLPAREPLTSKKSLGPGMSRTSQLDSRQSYYNRHTGGKSLGNPRPLAMDDERDELDDDDAGQQKQAEMDSKIAAHNKTYTQRLQDQISMLGKSQSNMPLPTKSMHTPGNPQPQVPAPLAEQAQMQQSSGDARPMGSPKRMGHVAAPGAFPEDGDDWIAAPTLPIKAAPSPRPVFSKSHSTDVMDGVHSKAVATVAASPLPKNRTQSPQKHETSPRRADGGLGHMASASVPSFPTLVVEPKEGVRIPAKGVSVSNPPLTTVLEDDGQPTSSKSPSRSFKESPLKQVKNKLSSILKSSKGLLASSAAISAEGKSSLLSPSSSKLGLHLNPSTVSIPQLTGRLGEIAYPDLSQRFPADLDSTSRPPSSTQSGSPRRTRASIEREKRELKEKEKETKEARRLAEQMGKLEKAREKEREKARVFSKEQEKTAEMERQLAAQEEHERLAREIAPPIPPKETPHATRTSPRRKPNVESRPTTANGDVDVEMTDASALMPPPSVPRLAGLAPARGQPVKRPLKPTNAAKVKQVPTVIRVNTTSSQHSQFHPSTSVLSATLQDSFAGSSHQLTSKSSKASLQTKPSLQSLKSSMSSTGRPKALELAARKKEQEEREAQRKREAKLELERKRAAQHEQDRRQEQQRRLDAEKQREKEKEQAFLAAEAKKNAQRQAAIEKAKLTMAPPPAVRSQPAGLPDQLAMQSGGVLGAPSASVSAIHRSQEESSRPVNAVLSNGGKALQKRPLPQEANEDAVRPPLARNGPSYQKQEVKRMRMSDPAEEDVVMETQPSMKGPPVRPSAGLKKDLPTKSLLPIGYAPAPSTGVTRDLFKATVTAQQSSHVKAAHPLDMAQVSKAAIPFAPNPNPAAQPHKTPARQAMVPGAKSTGKSATRSSPRFQNGDAIELPEIQTDDEDDEDDAHIGVAPWADSPDLRRALMRQETLDPLQVFGPPRPLNMEEVFNKNKDRWHKFRARTSSANWSGSDRLTEEDIRKDLVARDKMRREGGWSYELSRDLA